MDAQERKILIMGTGISGIAAAKLLYKEAFLLLHDANENLKKEEILAKLPEDFSGEVVLGPFKEAWKENLACVILSPGVPADLPVVEELREKGVEILGEIELAYRHAKGTAIAVTGTNGKTTTTALIGQIMKTFYESVFVVGNIGAPYTENVEKMREDSVIVAEVSSFQLETVIDFHPKVSVILNITPDHLDRHHTMENYIAAKWNVTKNQTKEDVCVLNYEDEILRKSAVGLVPKILWFSGTGSAKEGLCLVGEDIFYRSGGKEEHILNVRDMNLIGHHNYENAMAAIGAGIAMGVPMECIRRAVSSFVAVEHRIEYVATIRGVKYYNDSKGTNPDAAIQAVRAMKGKTCLIAGGYDKGSEYGEWIDSFEGKIKHLVLMGQTREKIAEAARKKGFFSITMVENMQEAVRFCAECAKEGEAVLLSPCCASWGMFRNYEERGRIFKELVHALEH